MPRTVQPSTHEADTLDHRWREYHRLRGLVKESRAAGDGADTTKLCQQLDGVRNQLVEAYLPLVKASAIRLKERLPRRVELDDLHSAGVLGLMDAIRKFDPGQKVLFTTFAPRRISGAMIDHLRQIDRAPRLVRERARKLERAVTRFRNKHGRPPMRDELATVLNVAPVELERILADGQVTSMVSLDQPTGPGACDGDAGLTYQFPDPRAASPLDAAHRRSVKELLCKQLSRHEQLIVVLYYFEGMTMKEIGQTLDLSESRVSQMHTSVKERLKAHLRGRAGELIRG